MRLRHDNRRLPFAVRLALAAVADTTALARALVGR